MIEVMKEDTFNVRKISTTYSTRKKISKEEKRQTQIRRRIEQYTEEAELKKLYDLGNK